MSNKFKRTAALFGAFAFFTLLVITFQNADTVPTTTTSTTTSVPSLCGSILSPDRYALKKSLGQVFQGFGCETKGGLGGTVCTVKSVEDTGKEGTLRYCMEKRFAPTAPETPVVVVFAGSLSGQKIRLTKPINMLSFTTVDGRMPLGKAPVTITNARIPLPNPCVDPNSTNPLCSDGLNGDAAGNPVLRGVGLKEKPAYVWRSNLGAPGTLFRLAKSHKVNDAYVWESLENIIITDLVFTPDPPAKLPIDINDTEGRSSIANPCYLTRAPVNDLSKYSPRWTKGCPVAIDIGNSDPTVKERTTKVVIANNEFYNCSEKCLHGDGASDFVTITRNHFHDSYFASLVLTSAKFDVSTEEKAGYKKIEPIRYTFYHNHFERVMRRNPRCALGVWCHVYGNVIENWGPSSLGGFGLSADTGPKVVAEWNFFAPATLPIDAAYSASNPAVDSGSNHLDANGHLKDPPEFYMGRWVFVSDKGVVGTPMDGNLFLDPLYPFVTEKPFVPSDYYYYSTGGLAQETYDGIKTKAGPRTLAY